MDETQDCPRQYSQPHRSARGHHAALPGVGGKQGRQRSGFRFHFGDDPCNVGKCSGRTDGLTATEVGLTVIELSWKKPSNDGGAPITGYEIEFSPTGDDDSWGTLHANTEADSDGQNFGVTGVQTYFADTTPVAVAGGTTRHYRVRAINIYVLTTEDAAGAQSDIAMATTPRVGAEPNEPMAVAAVANGPAEINLTWTRSTTGSPTGYKIEYSKNGNLPWMPVADIGNVNKYSNTGLSPAATRHYRVSAVNGVGRGPHSSLVGQDHVAKTTPKGVPAAPTSLTATAVKADEAELYWTPPTNTGGAPITGYVIEYSTNGLAWLPMQANTEATDPAGQNSGSGVPGVQAYFADIGSGVDELTATPALAAGTTRHYRVRAINDVGMAGMATGLFSATATVTVPVSGDQPGMPRGVKATAEGSNKINLVWRAPSEASNSPITRYEVEYSGKNTRPWMKLTDTSGNTASHTALPAGTTRHYRVSAVNGDGRGLASDISVTSGDPATLTNMAKTAYGSADQMGTVTLSTQAPMVGRAITATLTDADGGVTGQMWQWEKSSNRSSWMDATGTGATTRSYTPVAADARYYLRATVTYTDAGGAGKMADGMATGAVALPQDQMGTVAIDSAPVVDSAVTASLSDPDGGVTGTTWKWASSAGEDGTYTDIGGATSASYTPVDTDAGMYLMAMATYTDKYRSDRMATSPAVVVSEDVVSGYDTDGIPGISIDELFVAIDAYFEDKINIAQLFAVIDAYFE